MTATTAPKPYNHDHARALYALRNGAACLVPSESATKRMEAEGHIVRTGKRIGNSTLFKLTPSGRDLLARVRMNERSLLTIF